MTNADDIKHLLEQIRLISKNIDDNLVEKRRRGEMFNIFSELGLTTDEVRLHSSFLAMLLDPNGNHGQGNVFLEAFVELIETKNYRVPVKYINVDAQNITVEVEKYIGKVTDTSGGRIDLYITDNNHDIIIENKILAGDQDAQMLRYWNFGLAKCKSEDAFKLIYLTLDGTKPSDQSLGKSFNKQEGLDVNKIICLSYRHDIKKWLERCVELTAKQPLIRETINQYINTINLLTNNTMTDNIELLQILSKEENISAVFNIMESRNELVAYVLDNFFIPKLAEYIQKLGLEMTNSKGADWVSNYSGINISNKEWKYFNFSFEFQRPNLNELWMGFSVKEGITRALVGEERWSKIQEAYSQSDKNNSIWIGKWAPEHTKYWNNADAMKEIVNGKMLNKVQTLIEEALNATANLDL